MGVERDRTRLIEQIPASLRTTIELCSRVKGAGIRTFQETCDAVNAERALELRDGVSRTHKVMLWAHHSHISHKVTGKRPCAHGQRLRERLGDQLYTIGVFAGEARRSRSARGPPFP